MPHKYTVSDQVRFLGEWFDTWLDYQKEDFLPVLVQAIKQSDHVNGIINDVSDMKLTGSGRRPSLFDCQVKLFHEWFQVFSTEERTKFLNYLKENDTEFYEKLDKNLQENVESEKVISPVNGVTTSFKEDVASPGSSLSSPLSSISQPQSPQDLSLDDNATTEIENKEVIQIQSSEFLPIPSSPPKEIIDESENSKQESENEVSQL